MQTKLSIILPCYNPPSGWAQNAISSFKRLEEDTAIGIQLIIVNDGGHPPLEEDITAIRNSVSNFKYIDYKINKGKGFALRKGIKEATAPLIIYTDIDFPYTHQSLIKVYQLLLSKNDVVIGTKDDAYYAQTPWMRQVISKTLRFFIQHLLRMPITDTQCGLKGFNQKGKDVFLDTKIERYLFDLEFVYQSFRTKPKLSIAASPSQLRPGIVFRKMNWTVLFQESKNFLKIMLKR